MASRIDREQVRYGLGYVVGKYQLGDGTEDATGGCDYCQGYRSPCGCTEDCRTTDSPIGPCPQSEEGKRIIADYWKQPPP